MVMPSAFGKLQNFFPALYPSQTAAQSESGAGTFVPLATGTTAFATAAPGWDFSEQPSAGAYAEPMTPAEISRPAPTPSGVPEGFATLPESVSRPGVNLFPKFGQVAPDFSTGLYENIPGIDQPFVAQYAPQPSSEVVAQNAQGEDLYGPPVTQAPPRTFSGTQAVEDPGAFIRTLLERAPGGAASIYNQPAPGYSEFAQREIVPRAGAIGAEVGTIPRNPFTGAPIPLAVEAGRLAGEASVPVTAGDLILEGTPFGTAGDIADLARVGSRIVGRAGARGAEFATNVAETAADVARRGLPSGGGYGAGIPFVNTGFIDEARRLATEGDRAAVRVERIGPGNMTQAEINRERNRYLGSGNAMDRPAQPLREVFKIPEDLYRDGEAFYFRPDKLGIGSRKDLLKERDALKANPKGKNARQGVVDAQLMILDVIDNMDAGKAYDQLSREYAFKHGQTVRDRGIRDELGRVTDQMIDFTDGIDNPAWNFSLLTDKAPNVRDELTPTVKRADLFGNVSDTYQTEAELNGIRQTQGGLDLQKPPNEIPQGAGDLSLQRLGEGGTADNGVSAAYQKAQDAIDAYEDVLAAKYGEKSLYSLTPPFTKAEASKLEGLYGARDAIGAAEDSAARAAVQKNLHTEGPASDEVVAEAIKIAQDRANFNQTMGYQTDPLEIARLIYSKLVWSVAPNPGSLDQPLASLIEVMDSIADPGQYRGYDLLLSHKLAKQTKEIMNAAVIAANTPGEQSLKALGVGQVPSPAAPAGRRVAPNRGPTMRPPTPPTGGGGLPPGGGSAVPPGGTPPPPTRPPNPPAPPPISNAGIPPQPGQYVGALRDLPSVADEVVTSDNRIVRAFQRATGIDPSVLRNTPLGQATTAYMRQRVAADELTQTALMGGLDRFAQRFTGRSRITPIDREGLMKVRRVGSSIEGKAPWEDVFSYPDRFDLDQATHEYARAYRQIVNEAEDMLINAGLPPRAKTGPNGWFFVPRQVKGKNGIEFRKPSSARLSRVYEDAVDGFAAGVRYDTDPRATLELHLRNAYREIIEKQLQDFIAPLGLKPSDLVPPGLMKQARAAGFRNAAAGNAVLAIQRARRGEALTTGTIRSIERVFPLLQGRISPATRITLEGLVEAGKRAATPNVVLDIPSAGTLKKLQRLLDAARLNAIQNPNDAAAQKAARDLARKLGFARYRYAGAKQGIGTETIDELTRRLRTEGGSGGFADTGEFVISQSPTKALRGLQQQALTDILEQIRGVPYQDLTKPAAPSRLHPQGTPGGQKITRYRGGLMEDVVKETRDIQRRYHQAVEAAKTATIGKVSSTYPLAPGEFFGKDAAGEIPIAQWRNRFFPQQDVDFLNETIGRFSRKGETTLPGMAAKGLGVGANLVRTLASTADLGLFFIHGLPVLMRNPAVWGRMAYKHTAAVFDPTVQARFVAKHIETFKEMARYGVPVGDSEFFAALREGEGINLRKYLDRLPGGAAVTGTTRGVFKQTLGRFGTSYSTGLGTARALMWEALPKIPPSERAQFIRNLTGGLDSRALGVGPNQRNLEGFWLAFSPRLLRSTAALMKDAVDQSLALATAGRVGERSAAGAESLRSLSQLVAGVTSIYVLTGVALGKSEQEIRDGLNPLNGKKFLSHEINGDWIGAGGQIRAVVQGMANLIANPEKIGSLSQQNPLIAFALGRGAPAASLALAGAEAASGGQLNLLPYDRVDSLPDLAKHVGRSALPFALQSIMEGQNWEAVAAGFFGARTSPGTTFEKVTKARTGAQAQANRLFPPAVAAAVQGVDYFDLGPRERDVVDAQLAKTNPKLLEQYASQRRERDSIFQTTRDKIDSFTTTYTPELDRMLAALFKGGDATVIRKAVDDIQTEIRGGKKFAYEAPEYQNALEGLASNDLQRLIERWYQLPSQVLTKSGTPDWDRIQTIQQGVLAALAKTDPKLAVRLKYNTQDHVDPEQHKLIQLYDSARPYLDSYYKQPEGAAREQWRAQNPKADYVLWLLGYVTTLRSREAAQMAVDSTDGREVRLAQ